MKQKTLSLSEYKQRIDQEIKHVVTTIGPPSPLREACQYALTGGGKRFRPIATLLVAEALGALAPALPAALAVEFFHTASLVADDLPCMDDDDLRRNQPATHRKHGEAVALLASYALIAAGYEGLARSGALLKSSNLPHATLCDRICVVALENATYNTGLFGATGGQFFDINPPDGNLSTIQQIIHQKTVSLFEIAFVCGWAFGGGALERLDEVKKLASHYGMAFQYADDLDDEEQDRASGRLVNIAVAVGREKALQMFHEEIENYKLTLKDLGLETESLVELAEVLG